MANKKDNKPKTPAPPPKTQQEALRQAQVAVQAAAAQQQQLQHQLAQADKPKEVKQIKNQLGNTTDKLQAMRQARDKLRTIMYTTPGTPGVKNDATIDSLSQMTAEDFAALTDATATRDTAYTTNDQAVADLSNKNEYDKARIDRQNLFDLRDSSDELASRGLFQSSIRDAELADINATAQIRKNQLDTDLKTLRITNDNAKDAARHAYDRFQDEMKRTLTARAQEASKDLPEYLINPTSATTHVDRLKIPQPPKKNNSPTGKPTSGPNIPAGAVTKSIYGR